MMAEPALTPDKAQIYSHLRHITRRWHELENKCVVEIVFLTAQDKAEVRHVARFDTSHERLESAAEHIADMNRHRLNAYAVVNPVDATKKLTAGRRASGDDIVASFFHFADADSAEAAENIRNFVGPKCTFHVLTGTQPCYRPHVYWELEQPTFDLADWSRKQAAIAATLGTDSVIDAPRMMRLGGTINWPKPKKAAKGYIPELATLRIYDPAERPPVSSERIARAFASNAPAPLPLSQQAMPSFSIDVGNAPQSLDRERMAIQAMEGVEWHNSVVRLVGSYVAKGLSDAEIHALTDVLTTAGYTVEDTRREVQQAIDGARRKGWTPEPPQPAPAVQEMQQQAAQAQAASWPTRYDFFDEMALQPRQWIYGKHYLRRFVSVLASAGGIGKTSLQIVEALAIATGKPLLGEEVREPCNVWLINLEDPMDEMQRRILAAMRHYGITPDEVRGKLFVDAGRDFALTFAVQTREGVTPNAALVDHLIKRIPELGIGCVFIDPFVGAHQINENDNMAVNAVVAQIRKVADETNCAIGLVHHIRKGNGEDATIDSVRGAGSLIGAARAARVINKVDPQEAQKLGVSAVDALGIFRVDDGKANLAPPASAAVFRRMEGVQIANGEWVGVATPFELPDAFEGVTAKQVMEIQRAVGKAVEADEALRLNSQAKNWVGHAVAATLDIDVSKPAGKARVAHMVKTWISKDVLRAETVNDTRNGRDVPVVVVGNWITAEEAGL